MGAQNVFGIYLNTIYIMLAGFPVFETYFVLKLHFKQILKPYF